MNNMNIAKFRKSKKKVLPMVGIGLVLCSTAFAQQNISAGTNDAQTGAVSERDPFWPVGHVPESLKKANESKTKVRKRLESNDWKGAMKKVVINGVSSRSNNDFFAVINGDVKSVNDTISVVHGGVTYTWAIASIKPPGSVKLRRVSAL